MSARVEARRLSGVDVGRAVAVEDGLPRTLHAVEHTRFSVLLWVDGILRPMTLAPSDLVTVTGRGQS